MAKKRGFRGKRVRGEFAIDDAFFTGELFLKNVAEPIVAKITKKRVSEVRKQDLILKGLMSFEKMEKADRSQLQNKFEMMKQFDDGKGKKALLDTDIKKIKKILRRTNKLYSR